MYTYIFRSVILILETSLSGQLENCLYYLVISCSSAIVCCCFSSSAHC